jgi:hypothetical protein
MREACSLDWSVLVLWFQSRASAKEADFSAMDRLIFAGLYRLAPSTVNALTIVKPETVVRWHRTGSDRTGAGNHDLVPADRRWRSKYDG